MIERAQIKKFPIINRTLGPSYGPTVKSAAHIVDYSSDVPPTSTILYGTQLSNSWSIEFFKQSSPWGMIKPPAARYNQLRLPWLRSSKTPILSHARTTTAIYCNFAERAWQKISRSPPLSETIPTASPRSSGRINASPCAEEDFLLSLLLSTILTARACSERISLPRSLSRVQSEMIKRPRMPAE